MNFKLTDLLPKGSIIEERVVVYIDGERKGTVHLSNKRSFKELATLGNKVICVDFSKVDEDLPRPDTYKLTARVIEEILPQGLNTPYRDICMFERTGQK